MARRPSTAEVRDSDERFKTYPRTSRVLTSLAEQRGISKQELLHEICHEFVRREVSAAKLLVAAAEGEGMNGIDGE